MKILQVLHDYLPEHVGGTEIHAHQLARILSARGHEVVGLACERVPGLREGLLRERELDGVRIIERIHQREFSGVAESWRPPLAAEAFRDVLERERPDVVHFHHLSGWGAHCISIARELGCAAVLTLHDYHLLCDRSILLDEKGNLCEPAKVEGCLDCLLRHPLGGGTGKRKALLRASMKVRIDFHREHLDAAQTILSPSRFLADAMAAAGLIDRDRISLLKAGYPGPLRRPRLVPANRPLRLGFVGGLYPAKGVHVLVEALRLLEGEPVELEIHGPLTWFPEYLADLRTMTEGHPVRFRGRFEPDDIDRVLAGFDVLVVPSLWYENAPLTVYEAWRNGMGVIATDVGGLAEHVTHDVSGLLFERGNAEALAATIRELIHDRDRITRLASGRPTIPTVEDVALRLEEIYAERYAEVSGHALRG